MDNMNILKTTDRTNFMDIDVGEHYNRTIRQWAEEKRDGIAYYVGEGDSMIAFVLLSCWECDTFGKHEKPGCQAMVFVSATHRRRGLATRIIKHIISESDHDGFIAFADNTASVQLL